MSNLAIRVENVGKRYRIGAAAERHDNFRDALVHAVTAPFQNLSRLRRLSSFHAGDEQDVFWALRDISFEVKHGEVLGIIGRNGAGKSTLLKVLSRITEPTRGRVEVHGRVGCLLEVGTGFHPELTGRENVYLNGSILGMDKGYIDQQFDEIVEFAGVRKFIDTPVKRYSSGMYLRLAFSVAAHLEPEILIIDEVLAVGDAEFQKKCLGKMGEVAKEGRTVLFVSHNMAAVEALCSRALLLVNGGVDEIGDSRKLVARYIDAVAGTTGRRDLQNHPGRLGGSQPLMREVSLASEGVADVSAIPMAQSLSIAVDFASETPFRPVLGVVVKTSQGMPVLGTNNRVNPVTGPLSPVRTGRISCHFENLPLMPGTYSVDLYLGVPDEGVKDLDIVHDALAFEILAANVTGNGKLPPAGSGPVYWSGSFTLLDLDSSHAESREVAAPIIAIG